MVMLGMMMLMIFDLIITIACITIFTQQEQQIARQQEQERASKRDRHTAHTLPPTPTPLCLNPKPNSFLPGDTHKMAATAIFSSASAAASAWSCEGGGGVEGYRMCSLCIACVLSV